MNEYLNHNEDFLIMSSFSEALLDPFNSKSFRSQLKPITYFIDFITLAC